MIVEQQNPFSSNPHHLAEQIGKNLLPTQTKTPPTKPWTSRELFSDNNWTKRSDPELLVQLTPGINGVRLFPLLNNHGRHRPLACRRRSRRRSDYVADRPVRERRPGHVEEHHLRAARGAHRQQEKNRGYGRRFFLAGRGRTWSAGCIMRPLVRRVAGGVSWCRRTTLWTSRSKIRSHFGSTLKLNVEIRGSLCRAQTRTG